MFVDASAIVAILNAEPDADRLTDALESARARLTSPIAVFEAVSAICRKRQTSVTEARVVVGESLDIAQINVVPLTPADGDTVLEAFARYGKGRGHPAQLNLGDCFAYAVARNHQIPMLFKGDDFTQTDIAGGP